MTVITYRCLFTHGNTFASGTATLSTGYCTQYKYFFTFRVFLVSNVQPPSIDQRRGDQARCRDPYIKRGIDDIAIQRDNRGELLVRWSIGPFWTFSSSIKAGSPATWLFAGSTFLCPSRSYSCISSGERGSQVSSRQAYLQGFRGGSLQGIFHQIS